MTCKAIQIQCITQVNVPELVKKKKKRYIHSDPQAGKHI